MQDIVEPTPSERDEEIYAAWESGKTLRVLARQFSVSVVEVERAIDRCLPVFNSQNQMRAYKREIQKLEDVGTKYYERAMQGEVESAHIFARINERADDQNRSNSEQFATPNGPGRNKDAT